MQANLSVVINLSAGDVAYAALTAASLAKAHRQHAGEIILVVDDTKAQLSTFYDHKKRYAEPAFTSNIENILAIAENLKQQNLADRVILVSEYASKCCLNKKYLGNRVRETHDFRGAPITPYLVGFDACQTRFLVRYDGDMILHQTNTDWVLKGIFLLESENNCIAVSPRPCPPENGADMSTETDSLYWFSTRCTLFDMKKIKATTPFVKIEYLPELALRKLTNKTYPPALESMLCRRLKKLGFKNFYLLKNAGWLLHPEQKDELFVKLLPAIIASVEQGNYPEEQANHEMLKLSAWENYFHLKQA